MESWKYVDSERINEMFLFIVGLQTLVKVREGLWPNLLEKNVILTSHTLSLLNFKQNTQDV